MIVELLIAQILAGPVAPSPAVETPLKAAVVLQRYTAALATIKEPRVLTFDYTLDQSGLHTLQQTHRVFRSGADERDETLTVDGKPLLRPIVRIFRGRRNRYTIRALSPRPSDYDFALLAAYRDAHHYDYVFRVTSKLPRSIAFTEVTIDGSRFLPSSIDFVTGSNHGSGTISFGPDAAWWVPYAASARATVAERAASERLSFYTYRFPPALPPSTFGVRPVPVPSASPLPEATTLTTALPAETPVPRTIRGALRRRALIPGAASSPAPL